MTSLYSKWPRALGMLAPTSFLAYDGLSAAAVGSLHFKHKG